MGGGEVVGVVVRVSRIVFLFDGCVVQMLVIGDLAARHYLLAASKFRGNRPLHSIIHAAGRSQ